MRILYTQERKCGWRKPGGFYLVSEPAIEGVVPLWTSIHPPVLCEDRFHRGPVLIDGDRLLHGEQEANWFVSTSADHREKMRADEWAIEKFGMTSTMRLRTGECAGLKGVDEAMDHLLHTVKYSPGHYKDAAAGLIISGLGDIPRALPHFRRFALEMERFRLESGAKELVSASAALWRMANSIPPSRRMEFIPHIMRMLVVFGLNKDALAMKERFLNAKKRGT